MVKYNFSKTAFDGVYIITTQKHTDRRGYFLEEYSHRDYVNAGLNYIFVQDNLSYSNKGVLRGLHFQKKYPQTKLIRVIEGMVFDVVVDLRKNSETFGKWMGVTLSSDNNNQLLIPKGFAHGYLAMSDHVILSYKCDEYYHPEDEGGIIWDDPTINIKWPFSDGIILSDKDKKLPQLNDLEVEY